MNASCTISSASARSPKRRAKVATARPEHSRKIRSTRATGSASFIDSNSNGGRILERPHFDRTLARHGRLRRPLERGVEILALEHPKTADVLFGLRKRAVRIKDLAVLLAHDGRARRLMEPT